MAKSIPARTSVAILCACYTSNVYAGPSYEVKCVDTARDTQLTWFDANPNSSITSILGRHHQLPKGLQSFSVDSNGNDTRLKVASYQPYEVNLRVKLSAPEKKLILKSKQEADREIGAIQKIVLENHSKVLIDDQPRLGTSYA